MKPGHFPVSKELSKRKLPPFAKSCLQEFRQHTQGMRGKRIRWLYVYSLAATSLANAMQAIPVIVSQMAYHRSHYAMQFQALLSPFWWSSGASHQSIHTLQCCGLSISNNSINQTLSEFSLQCLAEAQPIAGSPHLAAYDNINISLSSFYEQREDAPSKVQSGTVAVPHKLRNANPDHMRLQELLKQDHGGRDLHFSDDIQPSSASWRLSKGSSLFTSLRR